MESNNDEIEFWWKEYTIPDWCLTESNDTFRSIDRSENSAHNWREINFKVRKDIIKVFEEKEIKYITQLWFRERDWVRLDPAYSSYILSSRPLDKFIESIKIKGDSHSMSWISIYEIDLNHKYT